MIPSLREWHQVYHDQGLIIIGNHYPEFSYEKDLGNLREAVNDLGQANGSHNHKDEAQERKETIDDEFGLLLPSQLRRALGAVGFAGGTNGTVTGGGGTAGRAAHAGNAATGSAAVTDRRPGAERGVARSQSGGRLFLGFEKLQSQYFWRVNQVFGWHDIRVGWLCRKMSLWLEHSVGEVRGTVTHLAAARATGEPADSWDLAELDVDRVAAAFDDPIVFDAALHEGKLFELFLHERGPLLPEDEQLLAASWKVVERSVHEVVSVDPGVAMTLRSNTESPSPTATSSRGESIPAMSASPA